MLYNLIMIYDIKICKINILLNLSFKLFFRILNVYYRCLFVSYDACHRNWIILLAHRYLFNRY